MHVNRKDVDVLLCDKGRSQAQAEEAAASSDSGAGKQKF